MLSLISSLWIWAAFNISILKVQQITFIIFVLISRLIHRNSPGALDKDYQIAPQKFEAIIFSPEMFEDIKFTTMSWT